MSSTEIVIILSHLPIVISSVYALLIYRELEWELKIFAWFVFVSAIIQLLALTLALNRINNLPLLHIYVAAGFLLLAWFYRNVLANFIRPGIIWGTAACFLVYTIANSLFIEPFRTFNSTALTVESVLVVILSFSTFLLLLNNIVKEQRQTIIRSINWINSGLFIYYSSSLLIFYLTRNFPKSLNEYTWILHSLFSVVMYSCFFMGFWIRKRN